MEGSEQKDGRVGWMLLLCFLQSTPRKETVKAIMAYQSTAMREEAMCMMNDRRLCKLTGERFIIPGQ